MSSGKLVGLSALMGLFVLAACATTPEQETARAQAQAKIDAEISLRQGPSVSRVCPGGNDDWRALDDDILLLEARDQWYMVELSGPCDPDSAFGGIVTRTSGGSSCIARGDDVYTGPPRSGARCVITGLYEWDEDAEPQPAASADPVED